MSIRSWITTARLISLGIGMGLTEVLANAGANVIPVGWGHGGSGGVEGGEKVGFELSLTGEVCFDQGLDVVIGG
jgi:hypothetical protein